MRRIAIRLIIVLAVLLVVAQLAIPPLVSSHVEGQLTSHGGTAHVHLSAFPALRLLFGHGAKLNVNANGLSVDLDQNQQDVFRQLDDFSQVDITVEDSRAGPFLISAFRIVRSASHTYEVALAGDGNTADIARYAGSRLAGGFGEALAGLAAAAIGDFNRPVPFDTSMEISTESGSPEARNVSGSVAGLPAGPLAQIVANALLAGTL